jgi:2-keto-4-pentenoate hydratase/2-oxohepta-3-ene-1,7-dioic acid hydratase in catechol pathway
VRLAHIAASSKPLAAVEGALDGVFGYTVANDVSARDLQRS